MKIKNMIHKLVSKFILFSWLLLIVLNIAQAESKFNYAGQQLDGGDLFLRARYCDPETGTFLSKDPLGVYGGLNQYTYTANNPINATDNSGELLDFVIDGGFIAYDLYRIGADNVFGNKGNFGSNLAALGGDLAGLAIPFATGGGAIVRASGKQVAAKALGNSNELGKAGEQLVGAVNKIDKNNAKFVAPGGNVRIPDFVVSANSNGVPTHLAEVKNLTSGNPQSLTSQLRDNISLVGKNGQVDVYLPKGYPVTGPLAKAFDDASSPLTRKNIPNEWFLNGRGPALPLGTLGTQAASLFDYFYQSGAESGVLIDKAATLIESNLADIKGATYDPVSKQIIFLGSNTAPGVDGIDMDYFYTAVKSVYGSAAPPAISLDAPAAAASLWQDFGDGDGVFEANEWGGFSLRYNPLWSLEDTNIKVRIRCRVGSTNYDFAANFQPQTVDWLQFPNGEYPMHLVYIGTSGTAPPGIGVLGAPFAELPYGTTHVPDVSTNQTVNGGQDWTYPFQIYNGGTATMTNFSFAVIPDRQHRRFGGRLEDTKLGWVLQEADRIIVGVKTEFVS